MSLLTILLAVLIASPCAAAVAKVVKPKVVKTAKPQAKKASLVKYQHWLRGGKPCGSAAIRQDAPCRAGRAGR